MTDNKEVKDCAKTEEIGTDDKISKKNSSGREEGVVAGDFLQEMETRLESKEQECKEVYDRFFRVSAEFENYKKRSAREMSEFRKFSNETLIKKMLPVVDDLERAINSMSSNECANSSLIKGVDIIFKEILRIFEGFGVKHVESVKKPFDPNLHQAVMRKGTDDCPENTVINEIQKGYMMYDRLLRPAMVVVSMPKIKSDDKKNKEQEQKK